MKFCIFVVWLATVVAIAPVTYAREIGALPASLSNLGDEAKTVPEISKLQDDLIKGWATQIANVYRPKMSRLQESYVGAIERQMASSQQRGDLPLTLAFRAELETVKKNNAVEKADLKEGASPSDVKISSMRKIFHDSAAKYLVEVAEIEKKLTGEFGRSLNALTAKLTKTGRIKEAIVTRAVANSIASADSGTGPLVSVSTTPNQLYRDLNDITKLFPLGYDMTGDDGFEKTNKILAEKVLDAPVRWVINVDAVKDSPLYLNKRELVNVKTMVSIGGRNLDCYVRAYYNLDEILDKNSKGDSVEVVGRIAACSTNDREGGRLIIDIANAAANSSKAPNPLTIPIAPKITILSATWGGGNKLDVKELIATKVVARREVAWANPGGMKGDPDPGWVKGLNVHYKIGDEEKRLSRGEGGKLTYEALFE